MKWQKLTNSFPIRGETQTQVCSKYVNAPLRCLALLFGNTVGDARRRRCLPRRLRCLPYRRGTALIAVTQPVALPHRPEICDSIFARERATAVAVAEGASEWRVLPGGAWGCDDCDESFRARSLSSGLNMCDITYRAWLNCRCQVLRILFLPLLPKSARTYLPEKNFTSRESQFSPALHIANVISPMRCI